jgi:hypothetical protein
LYYLTSQVSQPRPVSLRFFADAFLLVMASMTFGSVFMVLILIKYVKTRRILFSHERRNGWFGSSGEMTGVSTGTDATTARANRRAVYDRALIIRFTTGFIILLLVVFPWFMFEKDAES